MPFLARPGRADRRCRRSPPGFGGLAVIGARRRGSRSAGRLDAAALPLLTLLALSAFVPLWEIAQVGRQLAETLGAARRVFAVHDEPVTVLDGPGGRGARARRTDGRRAPGRALRGGQLRLPARGSREGAARGLLQHQAGQERSPWWAARARARRLPRTCCCGSGTRRAGARAPARRGTSWGRSGWTTCGAAVALVAEDTYLFDGPLRANLLLSAIRTPRTPS